MAWGLPAFGEAMAKDKAKTRFERMVPVAKKAPKRNSKRRPIDWEEEARFRGAFPFEHEQTIPTPESRPLETIVQDPDDEPQEARTEMRINKYAFHHTALVAFENSLHQAYVSGYADAVRQLESLDAILRKYSRSKALRKEVSAFIRKIKKDLASGYKCLPN